MFCPVCIYVSAFIYLFSFFFRAKTKCPRPNSQHHQALIHARHAFFSHACTSCTCMNTSPSLPPTHIAYWNETHARHFTPSHVLFSFHTNCLTTSQVPSPANRTMSLAPSLFSPHLHDHDSHLASLHSCTLPKPHPTPCLPHVARHFTNSPCFLHQPLTSGKGRSYLL